MKLYRKILAEGGLPSCPEFWGVAFVASRQFVKKKYQDDDEAILDDMDRTSFGDPSEINGFRASYFKATIRIYGKARHLGVTATARKAAQLYDSALFHLWGMLSNPQKSHFNFPDEFPPELFQSVEKLKEKIRKEMISDYYPVNMNTYTDEITTFNNG